MTDDSLCKYLQHHESPAFFFVKNHDTNIKFYIFTPFSSDYEAWRRAHDYEEASLKE